MKTRETIDFGIDLGTTNSAVAVVNGQTTNVRVFRSAEGFEYTPSAVWEDKSGTLRVGRIAKEKLHVDPENAHSEFKLRMGESGAAAAVTFVRSGRRMTAVQLSTEVLKALRADVLRESGEVMDAAVITVPAAFELPSCEATKQAADAAGFKQVVLLSEPTAAALAYLEDFKGTHGHWLVFDFGGGTFDAAVVQLKDGGYDFIAHAGDNQLGGKLIDWAIVNELFIPALTREYPLTDFRMGNRDWKGAVAKLKNEGENAKIGTTTHDSVEVTIEFLCNDDKGQPVTFDFTLHRKDVNRLCETYARRAIEKCREALRDAKLRPADVISVLLVGGPTLMPYFRQTLADATAGLGIPLDFSQDPLTVVARGAAKYARRQRRIVTPPSGGPDGAGQATLTLTYKPVGPDTDPLVSGRLVIDDVSDFAGYSVEFTNTTMRPPWSSGRIGLSPEGAFATNLEAEKGPEGNAYAIRVFDAQGNQRRVAPEGMSYTVGTDVPRPALINSIGVGLVGNRFSRLLTKGVPLPARKTGKYLTAVEIKRGQPSPPIVMISEGENLRFDRNRPILEIRLKDSDLPRDLPAGTEVDVRLAMDESRLLRAIIMIGDLEMEGALDWSSYRRDADSVEGLRQEFAKQKQRLDDARRKAKEMNVDKAQRLLLKLDADRAVPEIETSLASANVHDEATKCSGQLTRLAVALDAIEDVLAWPAQVTQANSDLVYWKRIIENEVFNATPQEKTEWTQSESRIREILKTDRTEDADRLKDLLSALDDLGFTILRRSPTYWIGRFEHLEKRETEMTNRQQAQAFIQQGRRAIEKEDYDSLQSAVRQLSALLPVGAKETKGPILFER